MTRILFAAILSVVSVGTVQAGPIPWMYSATFRPAGGADDIHLGNVTYWEYNPDTRSEQGTAYHVLLGITKTGYSRSGTETPTITPQTPNHAVTLFDFGNGGWTTRETLPTDQTFAMNRFVLEYAFADGDSQSETYRGSVEGTISASGIFTSGTGNFSIGLDHTDTVRLGNRIAKVRFAGFNSESHSSIVVEVTDVVETPEPATLALAGIGLGGILGHRGRRLRKRKALV